MSIRRVECQKLGEDLQQSYRAANQALEEIPAFEDLPRVDRNTAKELAEKTGSQAISAFRNSRGAAGTSGSNSASDGVHGSSENGSSNPSSNGHHSRAAQQQSQNSGDSTANAWERGANAAASRIRSAATQLATAAKEEVGHSACLFLSCPRGSD